MLLTELTDLIERGYSVSFHEEWDNHYPPQRAIKPYRCRIDKPEQYGANGWGDSLPEALAEAVENLKYTSVVDRIGAAE